MQKAVAIVGLETIKDKNDNPKFSVTFLNNVETWKKEHPSTKLVILDARVYKELDDPMGGLWADLIAAGPIDTLLYSGHSDSEILYVFSKYRKELDYGFRFIMFSTLWDEVKFNSGAKIYLAGCQAGGQEGKRFDVCIAQDIADKTGVSVFAFLWRSSQHEKKGQYYQESEHGGFVEFTRKNIGGLSESY